MAVDIQKFIIRFSADTQLNCDKLETEILALESVGFSLKNIDSLFRIAHTIKGAARMLKLEKIGELSHEIENVLEDLREAGSGEQQAAVNSLLGKVDAIRGLAAELTAPKPAALPATGEPKDGFAQAEQEDPGGNGENNRQELIQISVEQLDDLVKLMGEFVSFQFRKNHQWELVKSLVQTSRKQLELLEATESNQAEHWKNSIVEGHKQVQTLYNLLRDDTIIEQQLLSMLQERSLQLRMLPISTIFDKFKRTVRDMAVNLGKDIELHISGGHTKLDRKIIEGLEDCLLHMLRNAADHGIEMPEARVAAGKKSQGTISLTASYDGGHVSIVVKDDGAGMNSAVIKNSAVKKRLVTSAELDKMSKTDILQLIFLPGFSTSSMITDISGRGVGMDVVRKTIEEELNGTIKVDTEVGVGTRFILKVPITLALSKMLLVLSGGKTFAISAALVKEVVIVQPDEIIEVINQQALRLREQIIPLAELAVLVRCPDYTAKEGGAKLVVIIDTGSERVGLIVEDILHEADMLVKPLPAQLKKAAFLSGFVAGSDREIFSVLNISAVLAASRSIRTVRSEPVQDTVARKILVVDDSVNTREIQKSIFEAYGYHVEVAADGLDALDKTAQIQYDAVITDIEMPKCDGFTFTQLLRNDERYRDVPVIIVTSREKDEDRRRGIDAGANAYIVKGAFDQNNLIETVQNLIG